MLCAACLLASVAQASGFDARVRAVVDGDTLTLEDGRSVRLIGINTPEKAHGRKPGEPLADAATRALEQQVGHGPVRVITGPEKSDRHGRLLAWIEVGGRDTGLEQVRGGLAAVVAFPPNIGRLDSYLAAEHAARNAGRGIWNDRYFAPRDARDPEAIRDGFGFYRGTVSGSGESKKYVYLDLGPELAIRVTRTNWNRFFRDSPKDWIGRAIVVRGWVNSDWKLEVRHPSMIESQD